MLQPERGRFDKGMIWERAAIVQKSADEQVYSSRNGLLLGLTGLIAVAAVPAFAVLLNLQLSLRDERASTARAAALQQAELTNVAVGQVVDTVKQVLVLVGGLDSVSNGLPGCSERLERLRAGLPEYALIAVINPDGSTLCSASDGAFSPASIHEIEAPLHQVAAFTVGWYVPRPGTAGLLSFAMPFKRRQGQPGGLIVAGLDVASIGHALEAVSSRTSDAQSLVLDRRGVVVARQPDSVAALGEVREDFEPSALNGATSATRMVTTREGALRAFGYVPANKDPVGLFVGTGLAVADVNSGIDQAANRGTLMLLVGVVCSFALALLFAQRYLRDPTAVLLDAARRWGSGDLAVRARTRPGAAGELAQMARAFNTMAELLQAQQTELHALNGALEVRVAERTRALLASNNRLQVEIAERELTEGNLRQAQKLHAVGQLAGGMAHEFNNLLTVVLGSVELLRKRAGEDPRQVRLLETMVDAVDRGSRLTAQLLGFSRKQPLLAISVDLAEVIQGMTGLLSSTLGTSVRVQSRVAPDLWPVLLDPNLFEAALLNLGLNARDAMPGGGRLAIVAANATIGPDGPSELPAGGYVRVVVSDSGIGMSQEVLSRAFEPFYTTKALGRGSGLGLSQVHGLAQQIGGSVVIDSRPGEGTNVTILLPRSRTAPAPRTIDADRPRPALDRDHAILLVDDDDQVREVTALTLMDSGYQVVQAVDAADGLAKLEAERPRIGMLIADHAMPGMTGREMLSLVRGRWPKLPFLLATGYADFADLTADGLTVGQIVRKPFRVGELLARIELVCSEMAEGAAEVTP